MLLYSKCVNEETNEYIVINQIEAKKLGWVKHEIELAYDGKFYLEGHAPEKPQYEINAERIAELKQLLADTDYVVIKLAEDAANREEYADVLANRKAWRAEINELEASGQVSEQASEQVTPVEEVVVPQTENAIEEID